MHYFTHSNNSNNRNRLYLSQNTSVRISEAMLTQHRQSSGTCPIRYSFGYGKLDGLNIVKRSFVYRCRIEIISDYMTGVGLDRCHCTWIHRLMGPCEYSIFVCPRVRERCVHVSMLILITSTISTITYAMIASTGKILTSITFFIFV